ncbi:hypothetical protein RJ640_019180 [Escallonia rubra]|uniref:Mitochondrial import inner membrane translocase subunit n=1 Tax=Escallonia rubra TaxID=112253 RepID=A0AA88UEV1_9ASTE|nr:hypothetical protein RJ640_019180 [Escallonia rubra]
MDSFSTPSGGASPQVSQDFMDQLKNQLAQAYAEEFLEVLHTPIHTVANAGAAGNERAKVVAEVDGLLRLRTSSGKADGGAAVGRRETVRGKCFDKCITKPGSSLSGSESSCVSRCVDRYIEATGIISRALFSQQR